MSNPNYRICSNCIMDTSDAGITFDARGWCDYCNNYHDNILPNWHTGERGQAEIEGMVAKIKKDGEGREYDRAACDGSRSESRQQPPRRILR